MRDFKKQKNENTVFSVFGSFMGVSCSGTLLERTRVNNYLEKTDQTSKKEIWNQKRSFFILFVIFPTQISKFSSCLVFHYIFLPFLSFHKRFPYISTIHFPKTNSAPARCATVSRDIPHFALYRKYLRFP